MKRARVAIFEDDKSLVDLAKMNLVGTSHEIVVVAHDRSSGLDALDAMYTGNEAPTANVFVVDGNLGRYCEGRDGREIIDRIRRLRLPGYVIGASEDPLEGVDRDPGKSVYEYIDEALDTLPDVLPRRD